MSPRFPLPALALLLLIAAAPSARAGEPRSAASVTEPGRSLRRALNVVLGGTGEERTLLFLIDPTPSLQTAGFSASFALALQQHADALKKTSIGLAVVGQKKSVVLPPTREHARLAPALKQVMSSSGKALRNVYAAARTAATSLAGRPGARELILVTLENGDTENDLEAVVTGLKRAHVRFSAITSEAYLADTFWISSSRKVPRGTAPGSGDGPYLSMPWGWLFQMTIANETTPSGFAQYGLTRLASETDGHIFLYAEPGGAHKCAYFGLCSFCNGDHLPKGEDFRAHRMKAIAPLAVSRTRAGKTMARDPHFRALVKAWGQAAKDGLVRSRPSVRFAGGGLKPERRQQATWAPLLGSSLSFSRLATKGEKALKACDRIIASLTADLDKIGRNRDSQQSVISRYSALADFTLAMLHITRTNLLGYIAWCRDVAPMQMGKEEQAVEPPEIEPTIAGRRVAGMNYTPLCLCHGVAPFRALRMPGGKAWSEALDALDGIYSAYMRRYAHTPYAMALRHQGLARFHFTYRGTGTPPPVPRPNSTDGDSKPTTETARPDRAGGGSSGGGSSGGSGAPTTGGG